MDVIKIEENRTEIVTDFLDSSNDHIMILLEKIKNDYYLTDEGRTLSLPLYEIDEDKVKNMLSKLKQFQKDIVLHRGEIRMKTNPLLLPLEIATFTRAIAIVDYSFRQRLFLNTSAAHHEENIQKRDPLI